MGTKSFIFTLLYGVVQNIALPFIIVIYLTTLSITQPWQLVTAIAVVVYSIYLAFLLIFYLIVLLAISEKPKQDLRLMPWLLIYPVYALFMRLLAAFAVMNEMLRRSHEESAMAPWWVLKRGRKF
jgi:presenilin-like A22 family membrane protease